MKFKILFLIALICTVFMSACLDSNQSADKSINPLNKNIEPLESAYPENLPFGDEMIWYQLSYTPMVIGYTNKTLLPESDLAFYGTLKSINPSVWSTENQKPPSALSEILLPDMSNDGHISGKGTVSFKNGTALEYNTAIIPGSHDYIHTTVVFEVNDVVKGKNETEVTVIVQSGQAGNYFSAGYECLTIWDLEIGQEYLIYLRNDGTESNSIMYSGIFAVIE